MRNNNIITLKTYKKNVLHIDQLFDILRITCDFNYKIFYIDIIFNLPIFWKNRFEIENYKKIPHYLYLKINLIYKNSFFLNEDIEILNSHLDLMLNIQNKISKF